MASLTSPAPQLGTSYFGVGTSAAPGKQASMSGVVYQYADVSGVSTATTGADTTLDSVVIPANLLNANGKALRITAWGAVQGTASATALKVFWGNDATPLAAINTSTASVNLLLEATIIRTGAATQQGCGEGWIGTTTAASQNSTANVLGYTQSLTADLTLAIKVNQATASNFKLMAWQVEVLTEGSPT